MLCTCAEKKFIKATDNRNSNVIHVRVDVVQSTAMVILIKLINKTMLKDKTETDYSIKL